VNCRRALQAPPQPAADEFTSRLWSPISCARRATRAQSLGHALQSCLVALVYGMVDLQYNTGIRVEVRKHRTLNQQPIQHCAARLFEQRFTSQKNTVQLHARQFAQNTNGTVRVLKGVTMRNVIDIFSSHSRSCDLLRFEIGPVGGEKVVQVNARAAKRQI
jgi:hypothetical protein